jgi:tRNA(Ile)-lysidine synthase
LAVADPLTFAEFEAALAAIGGFEPRPLIAVGVSGGPDSLTLAILADRWARERGGEAWALTVDHRLRPESTAEAETVGAWLAARGIRHEVLVWRGTKPATGIQEAARAARHGLLAEWCVSHGCLHLLLAHHRDDQAETYLIRRGAGSGVDGLAGMAAVRELPQLRLVRPLLGVAKTRLAAFLETEGQPYLLDPSNLNPVFERSRLRMSLVAPDIENALHEVRRNAADRMARERELAALLARAVSLHPAGFASIDSAQIVAAGELGEQALGRVVAVLGGAVYPIRRERLVRLRQALGATPRRARTLGGCRFVSWRGRVLALREAARAAPPLSLAPGGTALWDKRFMAAMPETAPGSVMIGALGDIGVAALPLDEIAVDNPLPRLIYPTLPAVWDETGLVAVPHLFWRRATTTCLLSLTFHPPRSLIGVGFTVV